MKAKDLLDTRHDESPLGPAGDRIAPIFATMVPLADASLEALRDAGALVVGEVTDPFPNAWTFHSSDGSHTITVTSALIDFYQSVSNILFAATHLDRNGVTNRAAATINDVVARLKELFEAWTPEGIAPERMAQIAPAPLDPERAELAQMLTTDALTFILSHEFGHVLYYKPPKGRKPAAHLTEPEETQADVTGFTNMVFAAAEEGRGPMRMSIAGAVVSLRVLAVLGDLGHKFGEGHPPPEERLRTVIRALRSISSSEREFWSMSTIAFANDDQLAHAGSLAMGKDLPFTFERATSRMVSILEEIAKGRKPPSELLAGMNPDFLGLDQEALAVVAGAAAMLFPAVQLKTADLKQDALWTAMGTWLRAGISNFPPAARALFQQVFPPVAS